MARMSTERTAQLRRALSPTTLRRAWEFPPAVLAHCLAAPAGGRPRPGDLGRHRRSLPWRCRRGALAPRPRSRRTAVDRLLPQRRILGGGGGHDRRHLRLPQPDAPPPHGLRGARAGARSGAADGAQGSRRSSPYLSPFPRPTDQLRFAQLPQRARHEQHHRGRHAPLSRLVSARPSAGAPRGGRLGARSRVVDALGLHHRRCALALRRAGRLGLGVDLSCALPRRHGVGPGPADLAFGPDARGPDPPA